MMVYDMDYLILILLVTSIAASVLTLNKLKRVDLNTWDLKKSIKDDLLNEFRQNEALDALFRDLKLEKSLPPTRGWAGSPDFLAFLAKTILDAKPAVIVECSSGISTIVSARAAQLNNLGHVYSLEHEPVFAEKTRNELARHGLQDWATVIEAPLEEVTTQFGLKYWYSTAALPDSLIDLLVVDGPPETTNAMARYPAGPQLIPRMSLTGRIILDDAERPDEKRIISAWLEENDSLTVAWQPCEKGLAVISAKPS